jgi:hypothetical protein
MGNPEFDKKLKKDLGDAYSLLKCKECNAELITCPHCGEALCPEGCKDEE